MQKSDLSWNKTTGPNGVHMWLFSSDGFSWKGNDGHIQKKILRVSSGVRSTVCGGVGGVGMLGKVSRWECFSKFPTGGGSLQVCWQPRRSVSGSQVRIQSSTRHSARRLQRTALLAPCLSLWAHGDTGFCLRCWATAGWMLLLCASPTVLLTYFSSLLFRVWLWNLPWWIQISKTCWKISQLESFAENAFSELCSGNGLSGSCFFFFFFFSQYCCLKIQLQMFCIQKDLVQPLQSRDE